MVFQSEGEKYNHEKIQIEIEAAGGVFNLGNRIDDFHAERSHRPTT